MARKFAEIAFTPSVKAAQQANGSRRMNQRFEEVEEAGGLGEAEAAFIAARDSFYQATVSETSWPYVQLKGGPVGFLKVLDGSTLGYADFRGNVQYLSLGNMHANDRVALILMDYPNQQRLKIWARARVVDLRTAPALAARLALPEYRARVERGILLDVAAFDWNCPQHITPRFSLAELAALA